jgi:ankyrin repeat protein
VLTLPPIVFRLQHGANVDAANDRFNKTVLLIACSQMDDHSVIKMLLDHGASPNKKGGYPHAISPLYAACSSRASPEVIRLLVAHGADPSLTEDDTLMTRAAEIGDIDMVKLLFSRGAKINGKSRLSPTFASDDSPLQAAVRCRHHDIARFLIANGADVNVKSGQSGTPIQIASKNRDLAAVQVLLEQGKHFLHASCFQGEKSRSIVVHFTLLKQQRRLRCSFTDATSDF